MNREDIAWRESLGHRVKYVLKGEEYTGKVMGIDTCPIRGGKEGRWLVIDRDMPEGSRDFQTDHINMDETHYNITII